MNHQTQARIRLGITVLMILTALFWVTACAPNLTPEEHLAKAQSLEEQGEFRAAIIALKSALQKNPNLAEARFRLGALSLRFEDGATAESELRRAQTLNYPPAQIRLPLARALLLRSKFEEVEELASKDNGATKDQHFLDGNEQAEAEFTAIRGHAKLALGDESAAASLYEQATVQYAQSPDAALGKATLALLEKDIDGARKLLQEALKPHPKFAAGWSLLGDIERDDGNLKEADAAYTHAIDNHPTPAPFQLKRALARLGLGDHKGALADVDAAASFAPKSPTVHYTKGIIAYAQARYADAKGAFRESLIGDPDNLRAQFYLGVTEIALGEHEQAESILSRVVAKSPGLAAPRRQLAIVYIKLGDSAKARELLEPVVAARPEDAEALALLGMAASMSGDSAAGVKYLQKANALKPDLPSLKTQTGLALLAEGDIDKGFESLAAAVALDPTRPTATVAIFMSYLQAGNFAKAAEAAKVYQKASPQSLDGFNMEALAERLQGNKAVARAAYEKVISLSPGDPSASHGLAELALEEGKFDDARQLYAGVLSKDPGHLRTIITLANLDFREGKTAEGVNRLRAAIELAPEAMPPKILLTQHYLESDQLQKIEPLFAAVKPSDRNMPSVRQILGRTQLALGNTENAHAEFAAWAKAAPQSADAHYYLGLAQAQMGKEDESINSIETALARDTKHFLARVAHVRAAEYRGKHTQAVQELEVLKEKFPGHPEVLAQEGWLAQQQNKPEEAVKAYAAAFDAAPSADSAYNLARAKLPVKDGTGAINTLKSWVEDHTEDVLSKRRLAMLQLSLGHTDDAQDLYEQIVEQAPGDTEALNNLAWLLTASDPEAAWELIERARQIAPDSANIMDTAAQVAFAKGDTRGALALMKEAAGRAPENPDIRVRYAELLVESGDKATARDELEDLERRGKSNDVSRKLLGNL